jgi:hypothetical protein
MSGFSKSSNRIFARKSKGSNFGETATQRTGIITMSMRELDRLESIQAVIDGLLKLGRAAELLTLMDRQVRRLVNRVRDEGPPGIVSRRRSQPGNHRLPTVLTKMALDRIRNRYLVTP